MGEEMPSGHSYLVLDNREEGGISSPSKAELSRWSILTRSGNCLLGSQMALAALQSGKGDASEESGVLKEAAELEGRRSPERRQEGHQTRQPRPLGRIGNLWSPDLGVSQPVLCTIRLFTALPREDRSVDPRPLSPAAGGGGRESPPKKRSNAASSPHPQLPPKFFPSSTPLLPCSSLPLEAQRQAASCLPAELVAGLQGG